MPLHDEIARNTLRFYLNGQLHHIAQVDPSKTLLNFLREDMHKTGTKEGCAEGDCGACTVVIGELVDDELRLRSSNACIQFLPTLDGKHLFTVEALKNAQSQQLHPAQQAMVDYHGSQCGFCTPGFVMSLFALYKTNANPDHEAICDALSGNLCRCTGYKPIIDAAKAMYRYPINDTSHWLEKPCTTNSTETKTKEHPYLTELKQQLAAIQVDNPLELHYQSGELDRSFYAPLTINQLSLLRLEHPQATILAGGTDVGLWVTKQHRTLDSIIYIGQIKALQQISTDEHYLSIGSAVSLSDAFAELQTHYPELSELCRRFASEPVRNAGTLGGNIANGSPIGDSMPVLITLGTEISLQHASQPRRIKLEDFYIAYQQKAWQEGEWLAEIHIPLPQANTVTRSYKIAKRFDQDISAVCAAFTLHYQADGKTVENIRIAYGGMAATPKRAIQTEQALKGQVFSEANVKAAMQQLPNDYQPLSDMRASDHYRLRIAQNMLYRFYLETRPDQPLSAEQSNVFLATSEQPLATPNTHQSGASHD